MTTAPLGEPWEARVRELEAEVDALRAAGDKLADAILTDTGALVPGLVVTDDVYNSAVGWREARRG